MKTKIEKLVAEHGYKNPAEKPETVTDRYETATFEWCLKNTKLNIKTSSFFEIGAGSGNFFYFLQKNGVTKYLACEVGTNPIAQFKRLFPNQNNVILEGDALSVLKSREDEKFDCFIAWNVMEHLDDDYLVELFQTISQRLNSNGEIWILTPCAESIISSYNRYADLTHKRSFTVKNFITLGDVFGFKTLAKSGRIVAVAGLKGAIRYLHNKLIYMINRFLFAFDIGIREDTGVFSQDLLIILKKY